MEYIDFKTFQSCDMRLGTIRFVEPVEGTNKLLRCIVEFSRDVATLFYNPETGEEMQIKDEEGNEKGLPLDFIYARQIVSGIKQYFEDPQELVGQQALYVINLEPRTIRGVESQGMLMAIGDEKTPFALLSTETKVDPGSRVR